LILAAPHIFFEHLWRTADMPHALPQRIFNVRLFLASSLLTAALGCGSDDGRLTVYPVTGAVNVGGKPAPGAKVFLNPVDETRRGPGMPMPTGTVGPDGKFKLNSYAEGDGAPAGDYHVAIVWPEKPKRSTTSLEPPPLEDRLKNRYAVPDASGLTATVKEGPTDLPPFELPRP
jgi:hypothetical protein